jgi:hypothetical protein
MHDAIDTSVVATRVYPTRYTLSYKWSLFESPRLVKLNTNKERVVQTAGTQSILKGKYDRGLQPFALRKISGANHVTGTRVGSTLRL